MKILLGFLFALLLLGALFFFSACRKSTPADETKMLEQLNNFHGKEFQIVSSSYHTMLNEWTIIAHEKGKPDFNFPVHYDKNFNFKTSSFLSHWWRKQATDHFKTYWEKHYPVVKRFECKIHRGFNIKKLDPKEIINFDDPNFISKIEPTIVFDIALFHDNPQADTAFFRPMVTLINDLKHQGYQKIHFEAMIYPEAYISKIDALSGDPDFEYGKGILSGKVPVSVKNTSEDVSLEKLLEASEFEDINPFKGFVKYL